MKSTMAMILAGGRGKRMDIFCNQRPKPILPFAGKYRVIDITLSNCIHSQIESLAILVDYQRAALNEYLRQWSLANIECCNIEILQPKLNSYSGTADAIFQNLDRLESQDSDTILILAGDHIYNMDYRKMLSFHNETRADVTVGVIRIPLSEAHRFGTVVIEPERRIKEFVEKSYTPASNLASMGIYIFNRSFLIERLTEDAKNNNSIHDFGYSILPKIVKQDRIFGYEFEGYWQDIGTVEAYYKANMKLLEGNPAFCFDDTRSILTINGGIKPPITNVPKYIVNSLISPGCIIEGYVENSILSPGVWVGEKARVVNSIIMANTHIGYHSIVDRCILDEGVDIDKYCYVGFGTTSMPQVTDITLVGKDVSMGPETAIGRKSKIMPGLKLADLNCRFVAPETVVSVPV